MPRKDVAEAVPAIKEGDLPFPLPPLPATASTRDGQVIDPRTDEWVLRKRKDGGGVVRLNWHALQAFDPAAIHLAKLILSARMPAQAPYTTSNDLAALRRFSQWYADQATQSTHMFNWDALTAALARAFLDHGLTTANAGNDFARLRDIYRYGVDALRHPHFRSEVLLSLETIRAPGNVKGADARAGDPDKGELSLDEVDAILDAIGRGAGREKDRLSVWLCLELGRNSLQYTLLRKRDLRCVADPETGARLYQLFVRRIKKRTPQDESRAWPISEALGDALTRAARRAAPEDPLLLWLDPTRPELDLGARLNRFARDANLRSRRNGGRLLNLSPRRFRVTMLTRAADEGASAEKLAELADHSDLQNVMVYIDNSPSYVVRLGKRIDSFYEPALKRFRGKITSSREGTGNAIPGFSPHLPLLDLGGIGRCGAEGICNLAPPVSCYSCDRFIAFRDGPHRDVVTALERSMEGMNPRMGLQLAPTLAAARDLVRQLDEGQAVTSADEDEDYA